MADIARQDDTVVVIDLPETGGSAPAILLAEDGAAVPVLSDDEGADELPERAIRNDDGSFTLPLREAVRLRYRKSRDGEVREEPYAELVMHRLNGADMRAFIAASKEAQFVVAAARSCRIPEMKFNLLWDQMDGADCMDVLQITSFLLERGRKTGR